MTTVADTADRNPAGTHRGAGRRERARSRDLAAGGFLGRRLAAPDLKLLSRCIGHAVVLSSFAFVIFSGGVVTAFVNFPTLQQAAGALRETMQTRSPFDTDLWYEARFAARGVVSHDPSRSFQGLTLYSSNHDQAAWLIDMAGNVVHRWRLPATAVWGAHPPHIARPLDDRFTWWDAVSVFPDGDLLVTYVTKASPYGAGVVRIDKESKLVWKLPVHGHHAIDIGDDGRIYTLTSVIRDDAIPGIEHTEDRPYLDDRVTILDPAGVEIDSFSILEAFVGSEYDALVDLIEWNWKGDLLHANDVDLIDAALAERLPFAAPGDLLVSMRHLNAIAVIDPDTAKVVWAMRGPWVGQHDPDVLENGNILIFDNRGHLGPGGQSRVVEFDPRTLETAWAYTGTAERPLFSRYRSGQQRLPNGNTLIYEAETGRILEVAADGNVVWEFISPHRAMHEGKEYVAGFGLNVQRFAPEELPFVKVE